MAGRKSHAFLTEVDLRRPVRHRIRVGAHLRNSHQNALGISPNDAARKGKGRGVPTTNQAQQRSAPFCTYSQLAVTLGALANMPHNADPSVNSHNSSSGTSYSSCSSRAVTPNNPQPTRRLQPQTPPDTEGLQVVSTAVPQLPLPPRPASSLALTQPRQLTPPEDAEIQKMLSTDVTQIPTPSTLHKSQDSGSVDHSNNNDYNPFGKHGARRPPKPNLRRTRPGWQPLQSAALPQLESNNSGSIFSTTSSIITPSSQQELMDPNWHKMRMAEVASSGGISSVESTLSEDDKIEKRGMGRNSVRSHSSKGSYSNINKNTNRSTTPTPTTAAPTALYSNTPPRPSSAQRRGASESGEHPNEGNQDNNPTTTSDRGMNNCITPTSSTPLHAVTPAGIGVRSRGSNSCSNTSTTNQGKPTNSKVKENQTSQEKPPSMSIPPAPVSPADILELRSNKGYTQSTSAGSTFGPDPPQHMKKPPTPISPKPPTAPSFSTTSQSVTEYKGTSISSERGRVKDHPNNTNNHHDGHYNSTFVHFPKNKVASVKSSGGGSHRSVQSSVANAAPLKRLFELEEKVRQHKEHIKAQPINTADKYDEMMSIVQELKAIAQTPGSSAARPGSSLALSSGSTSSV